jgi:hypothetical protein
MRFRRLVAASLLAAFGLLPAKAQESDILDAALAHPFGTTVNGAPVRFGDPDLDSAELALHDFLPRPWTVNTIRPLFEAAMARAERLLGQEDALDAGTADEADALTTHLGRILAASRDPRAALSLDRALHSQRLLGSCSLASGLLGAFPTDAAYQALPPRGQIESGNLCPLMLEDALRWIELNRPQLETRVAALQAAAAPCRGCEQNAAAQIDRLLERLHASAPQLQFIAPSGAAPPRVVQFEGIIRPMGGHSGGSTRSMQRQSVNSGGARLKLPAELLGRSDLRVMALLITPDYETVAIDVDGTRAHAVIPVTLTPRPSKRFVGRLQFTGNAIPRRTVLEVDLRVTAANDGFGIFSGSMSTVPNIAQVVVAADGSFTLSVPDIATDRLLAATGNRFVLRARGGALTLEPSELELDRSTDEVLRISASPRERILAGR